LTLNVALTTVFRTNVLHCDEVITAIVFTQEMLCLAQLYAFVRFVCHDPVFCQNG